MPHAEKVLIAGGTLNIALAFVIGFGLSRFRLRDPSRSPHYLLTAHEVALQEGFMLLGLTFAVILSPLRAGLETVAASFLVASSVFQVAAPLVNHAQGVQDQFAARSPGLTLATINAVLASGGIAILVTGVLRGL